MKIRIQPAWTLAALCMVTLACALGTPANPTSRPTLDAPPRHFHLGFTPFPYDTTTSAVRFSYQTIAMDADIIAHHFDDGVPWPEALAGKPYPKNLQNDWDFRKASTPLGHKIYLAITPIRLMRDGLALYRGEQGDMPLPSPWDTYSFDHSNVKAAYLNHAVNAIEFFQPDYLAFAIEVNLLLNLNPGEWDSYLDLHQFIYTELKGRYPDLPIFATVSANQLLPGFAYEGDLDLQLAELPKILEYSDYFAISFYPFLSPYLTGELPASMFDDLFALSDKPIAIAETGYPAQSFTAMGGAATFDSSPEKQDEYVSRLLAAAESYDLEFVINFVLRDYDALWSKLDDPAMIDLALLWRDTGLYDENGLPRPALDTWLSYLLRPHQL